MNIPAIIRYNTGLILNFYVFQPPGQRDFGEWRGKTTIPARPPYIVGVNLQKLYPEATEMLAAPTNEKGHLRDSSHGPPLENPSPGAPGKAAIHRWCEFTRALLGSYSNAGCSDQ